MLFRVARVTTKNEKQIPRREKSKSALCRNDTIFRIGRVECAAEKRLIFKTVSTWSILTNTVGLATCLAGLHLFGFIRISYEPL
jgi:hypothetical protein